MKIFLASAILLIAVQTSTACDVCGCYFGVQPQYDKNFVGLRMRYRQYFGNINYSQGNTTINSYSFDLWTRFYPVKKVQVLAVAPFMYSRQSDKISNTTSTGLGDLMLIAQYQVFSNIESMEAGINHILFAGGGFKLPTGKYRVSSNESPSGSGSLDYLLSFNYLARKGKVGLNTNGSYKITSKNPNGYRYGNDFSATGHFFYWWQNKSWSILPHAGVYFESIAQDRQDLRYVENTGSSVWFYSVGADVYYKNLTLNLSFQNPFAEYYRGRQLENYTRLVSGVTLNF